MPINVDNASADTINPPGLPMRASSVIPYRHHDLECRHPGGHA